MSTYILVDTANTFFRARHVVRGDIDTKVGMALHITLNSIKKAWKDFNADHVVFCLEGRSWRKDYYEPYKRIDKLLVINLLYKRVKTIKRFGRSLTSLRTLLQTRLTVLLCNTSV